VFVKLAKSMALSGLSSSMKYYLNYFLIKEYGEMLKLEIDPENQSMRLEVLLKGEHEAIQIHVGNYEYDSQNGESGLLLRNVTTSRAWMNTLVNNLYAEGLKIPIDGQIASILKGVM